MGEAGREGPTRMTKKSPARGGGFEVKRSLAFAKVPNGEKGVRRKRERGARLGGRLLWADLDLQRIKKEGGSFLAVTWKDQTPGGGRRKSRRVREESKIH